MSWFRKRLDKQKRRRKRERVRPPRKFLERKLVESENLLDSGDIPAQLLGTP